MDYTTAYQWMQENASREDFKEFNDMPEEEAIEFAESLGAYDALDDEIW